MKKAAIAGGMVFAGSLFILAFGLLVATPAPALAQTFTMSFNNLPVDNVPLSTYIGLDRKLKAAPGQTLDISVEPPLTTARRVFLQATVIAQSVVGAPECTGEVGSAETQVFSLQGSGRTLSTNDFSGSSTIGIASSSQNQRCIDALADKIQKGVASLPAGIYIVTARLYDADTRAQLGQTATHTITISGSSTTEAVINLSSPSNDERVPQSPQVVFIFDTSIPGRLLCFEHSTLSQSPQDATRDLNSPLKCVDYAVSSRGTNQISATYPGISTRPWMAGKKYSWLFLGSTSAGGGVTDTRSSPIWSFTVMSNDPNYNSLVMALSNAPDPIGSTYENMVNMGYVLSFSTSNPIRIQEGNGPLRPIDITQVLTLLGDLGRRNVRVNAQIVNE
jgi:hypothetical protein